MSLRLRKGHVAVLILGGLHPYNDVQDENTWLSEPWDIFIYLFIYLFISYP